MWLILYKVELFRDSRHSNQEALLINFYEGLIHLVKGLTALVAARYIHVLYHCFPQTLFMNEFNLRVVFHNFYIHVDSKNINEIIHMSHSHQFNIGKPLNRKRCQVIVIFQEDYICYLGLLEWSMCYAPLWVNIYPVNRCMKNWSYNSLITVSSSS